MSKRRVVIRYGKIKEVSSGSIKLLHNGFMYVLYLPDGRVIRKTDLNTILTYLDNQDLVSKIKCLMALPKPNPHSVGEIFPKFTINCFG